MGRNYQPGVKREHCRFLPRYPKVTDSARYQGTQALFYAWTELLKVNKRTCCRPSDQILQNQEGKRNNAPALQSAKGSAASDSFLNCLKVTLSMNSGCKTTQKKLAPEHPPFGPTKKPYKFWRLSRDRCYACAVKE